MDMEYEYNLLLHVDSDDVKTLDLHSAMLIIFWSGIYERNDKTRYRRQWARRKTDDATIS